MTRKKEGGPPAPARAGFAPASAEAWLRAGRSAGFTLLEASIVLVIIGLIAAGASVGWGIVATSQRVSTNNKLDTVENALLAYRLANNSLPCPADASLPNTDPNYGVAAANPGSCTGGTPAATFSDATHRVVEGAAPFKTLNLPEEFMYDGWERKFAYAVSQPVTAANVMAGQQLNEMCGISVTDAGGAAGNRTSGAVYALVSFGPDGHGGYVKGGTRYNGGVTNSDEQTNCHCDVNANTTGYAASYVEKDMSLDASDAVHPFSDTVRFKERWQMMSTDDMYQSGNSVCNPGLRIDGTQASMAIQVIGTADINGDGIPDLILEGYNSSTSDWDMYVIFGQSSRSGFTPNPLTVPTSLNGTNGFVVTGVGGGTGTIYFASGDFNGDGIKDMVISGVVTNGYSNGYAILYGQSSGWPASIAFSSLTNTSNPKGTQITNVSNGLARLAAADLNSAKNGSNNIDDLIIGDYQGGSGYAGNVYIVWGSTTIPSTINVTSLGANGITLSGSLAGGNAGYGLAVGDFDGDGIPDIAIAAPAWNGSSQGYGYIVWGHSGAWSSFTLNGSMAAANGLEVNQAGGDIPGHGVSEVAAGDLNGDGKTDALFTAMAHSPTTGGAAGQIYVLFGSSSLKSSNLFDITTINGTNGTVLQGNWGNTDNYLGGAWGAEWMVLADINGDGILDLLTTANGNGAGYYNYQAFFGHTGVWAGTWTTPLGTELLTGSNGFRVPNFTGPSFAAVADVNGDGIADYIIGDGGASPGGRSGAGAVYIVKGKTSGWTTPISPGSISGGNGYEIDGANAGDNAGGNTISANLGLQQPVVTTGKFDNGTINDIAISAPGASPGGVSGAGSVYVIWGSTTMPATLNLSTVQ